MVNQYVQLKSHYIPTSKIVIPLSKWLITIVRSPIYRWVCPLGDPPNSILIHDYFGDYTIQYVGVFNNQSLEKPGFFYGMRDEFFTLLNYYCNHCNHYFHSIFHSIFHPRFLRSVFCSAVQAQLKAFAKAYRSKQDIASWVRMATGFIQRKPGDGHLPKMMAFYPPGIKPTIWVTMVLYG